MSARAGFLAAAVLLAGASLFALWPTAKRGEFTLVLSTRRADALGAKAFYAVLEAVGLEPVRRTHDLESIEGRGVLFSLSPEAPRSPLPGLTVPVFGKHERREVLRWVGAGGHLVLVSSRNTGLHRDLGIRVKDEDRPPPAARAKRRGLGGLEAAVEALMRAKREKAPAQPGSRTAIAAGPSPLTGGARQLSAPRFYHFDVRGDDPRSLFQHDGQAVAVALGRGEGLAVLVSTPYLASNVGLREADNLRFFHALAVLLGGGGRIVFDEYHHGQRRERGLAALAASYDLHFALGQLVLAVLLAAWAARRLPRGRARAVDDARGAGEHVAAMATLYARGRFAPFAATQLWNATLAAIASRLRLSGVRTARQVAEALRARGRADLAERLHALDRQHEGFGPKIKDRDLTRFAAALSRLRIDLDARGAST
jgi:hypothetical protein